MLSPRITMASVLSILRLALVPALLVLAAGGRQAAYSAVLAIAFATDVADGYLARRLGQASVLGARLDSAADLALFLSIPPALALLFPEWWRGHRAVTLAVLALALGSDALAFLRLRRLPSYHTWAWKLAGSLLAVYVVALLLGRASDWLFFAAVGAATLAALEEIVITFTLRQWQRDVKSLWHVRRSILEERASGSRALF